MTWAVKLLQENFNNVPLALDTANKRAIEAGIKVYNRTNGKPIVNSADAGSRISNIDLAAANGAIVIALCSADGIAKDNEERMFPDLEREKFHYIGNSSLAGAYALAVSDEAREKIGELASNMMPGTGSDPAYRRIDIDTETGEVSGLF